MAATIKGTAHINNLDERVFNVILETPGARGRRGLATLLWGGPGTAKTDKSEQHCFHRKHQFKSMSPAEGEAAYGVVPAVHEIAKGMIAEYGLEKFIESGALDGLCIGSPPPKWALPFLSDDVDGTIFFDDISSSMPIIQAAQLNCATHRRIAGVNLGRRVRVFGAANPIHQAAGGFNLAPALANRFIHLSIELPVHELVDHILDGMETHWSEDHVKPDPSMFRIRDPEVLIKQRWLKAFADSRAVFAAFLKAHPMSVRPPEAKDDSSSHAWPSGRSVELAIRAWAGCEIFGCEDLRLQFVAGACGDGFAKQFVAYSRTVDLPDIAALVRNNGEGWTPERRRVDIAHIVLSTAASLACDAEDRKEKSQFAASTWNLIDHALTAKVPTDVVFKPARRLVRSRLFVPQAKKPLTALRPLFEAAQLLLPSDVSGKTGKVANL